MAKKKQTYESKAQTVSIRYTSRASVKIGEQYYTVEATEERAIPDVPDIDLDEERKLLWDEVNRQVDNQVDDIYEQFEK